MLFTDSHFDALDEESERVAAFAVEFHLRVVPIVFPVARHPEEYFRRPTFLFEKNRQIHCNDKSGRFSPYRYNLIRRLVASRVGVVNILDLCEFDDALKLDALWDVNAIPIEGSLRNFASRINNDFAKYDMPWAVSYSAVHHCFILRFLPNQQTERPKYCLHRQTESFFQNSVSPSNTLPELCSSDNPVLPSGYIVRE